VWQPMTITLPASEKTRCRRIRGLRDWLKALLLLQKEGRACYNHLPNRRSGDLRRNPFSSNVTATQYVDDLERRRGANRDTYLASARTPALQQAALQYFDQQWAWL